MEGEAGQITHSTCHGIKTQKGWCLEELTFLLFVSEKEMHPISAVQVLKF